MDFQINSPYVRVSYSFGCYKCGQIFARAINGRSFQFQRAVCESCPPESEFWNWLPGSIWSELYKEFNDALPDGIVGREFFLHLAWAEKELEHEQTAKDEEGAAEAPSGSA